MICTSCRTDNPPQNRFCDACGAALEIVCAQCGAPLRAGARFCGGCGHRVAAAPTAETRGAPAAAPTAAPSPAPPAAAPSPTFRPYTPKHLAEKILTSRSALEGERRQVTVLFADIAGFTGLAERLDPEEVHRIVNRCFELITAEVHRFEGTINQYTGDGVMALFGAPIAHEDSARRALHAALGIQRALRDYARDLRSERDVTLAMRIGLNTGPVVVGRIGDDLRMDYTAVGDTTNLAARMQQIARPGSILVSAATHKVVSGFFEALDLGHVEVKGHAPVQAFEILRVRGGRSRLDARMERGLTKFVGRGRELATLLERFADVKTSRGQVVSIIGEAGIGKSRLLLEFKRALTEGGEAFTWLDGQCVSFGQSMPFLPLVDQLRRNFRIEEFDGEPEIIAKIEHGMRRMGDLTPHIPYIRYLMSVDPGDPAIAAMEPAARRRKMFEAARALALRGAALRPLILVFEDLHWIDAGSEEYLASLIDSAAAAPLMLVFTYRVGYRPAFGARSFHTTLTLNSLSEAETLQVASTVIGSEQFPEELRAALMEKAEGVPLFIEEVTKTLLDLGVLRRDDGGYTIVKGIGEVSVPDTIQGIIMARLDRLGEDGKRAVQLASVIGRQFLARLLERVAGMADRLDGLLQELKALEIIYEQGLLPEPAYVFKHAVIQDVAYNTLLRDRRRDLHRAVGYAIEELYADRLADHWGELAHHFLTAEEWPKAFAYLVASGDRAKDAYANQTALDAYARALEVADRISPPPPPRQLLDLHLRRGQVLRLLTRYDEAIAEAARMRDIARAAGDRRSEAEALSEEALTRWATFSTAQVPEVQRCAEEALALGEQSGDERTRALSLGMLGLVAQLEGDLDDADRKFEESLRISEAHGLPDTIAQAQCFIGAHANWRGDFPKALELCRRGAASAASVHDGFWQLTALAFDALARIGLGHYDEAFDAIQHALGRARDWSNIFYEGRLINSLGWLHQELGDFRTAAELDRQSADIGRRIKNSNVEVSAVINVAFDQLNSGEPKRALELLEETYVRVEKQGFGAHRWRWSHHLLSYIAETLVALGDPERAARCAEQCLEGAQRTGSAKYVSRGHVIRGEVWLAGRRWDEAERDLAAGLRVARAIGYPPLIARAAHALGRAQLAQQRMDDAHETLALAVTTLDAMLARIPDPALRQTFSAWPRTTAIRDTFETIRA